MKRTFQPLVRSLASAATIATLVGLAPTGASAATRTVKPDGSKETLTLWNYGALNGNPELGVQIQEFEKIHPNVTIKAVAEPTTNYFATLQASMISGRVPDLVWLFGGTYLTSLTPYLANIAKPGQATTLSQLGTVPQESIWTANGVLKDGTYAVPEGTQFYNGYYNKALFKKAGITAFPRDWSQLYAACTQLRNMGVTPMVVGNDGNGGEFSPIFNWSYLLAGVLPLSEWSNLVTGKLPYTDPAIVSQVSQWDKLYSMGCVNKDALTNSTDLTQFEQSKAAMFVEGNWDLSNFLPPLGKNLGVFAPPYSSQPKDMIVQYPGGGLGIPKASSHVSTAVEFLSFVLGSDGQKALSQTDQLPVFPQYPAPNIQAQSLLNMSSNHSFSVYPMFDNYMQPSVLAVAQKALAQAFVGQLSAKAALKEIAQSVSDLPSSQRNIPYSL